MLDLRVEPTPRKAHRVAPPVEPGLLGERAAVADRPYTDAARVVGTFSRLLFDVLARMYASLGFDAAVDDVVCSGTWSSRGSWSRPRSWTSAGSWPTWGSGPRVRRRCDAP